MAKQHDQEVASKQPLESSNSNMEKTSSTRRVDMTGDVYDSAEGDEDLDNTNSELLAEMEESSEFMLTPKEIHDQRLKLEGKRDRRIPFGSASSGVSSSALPGAFSVDGKRESLDRQNSKNGEQQYQDISKLTKKSLQHRENEFCCDDDVEASTEMAISPQEIRDQRLKLERKTELEIESTGAEPNKPGFFPISEKSRAEGIILSSGSDDDKEIHSSDVLAMPKTTLQREPENLDTPGAFGVSRIPTVYNSSEDEKDIEQPGHESDLALRLEAEAVDEGNQIERIREQQEEIERLRKAMERVTLASAQQAEKKPNDVIVAVATKLSVADTSKRAQKKREEPEIDIPSNKRQIMCCIMMIIGIIAGAVVGIVVSQSG